MTRDATGPGAIGPAILGADGARRRPDPRRARRQPRSGWTGHETFRHAVARLTEATRQARRRAPGWSSPTIDLFVYHQANGRILRAVGERLGLDPERVVDCIGRYGNTSAATIPIALWPRRSADGRLRDGARVLLAAFGAGFTWGGVVVEWGPWRMTSHGEAAHS